SLWPYRCPDQVPCCYILLLSERMSPSAREHVRDSKYVAFSIGTPPFLHRGNSDEPAIPNRVDRRDVGPRSRLHEDHPRLRSLLRRDVRGTLPRREGPSLRAGVRPAARL